MSRGSRFDERFHSQGEGFRRLVANLDGGGVPDKGDAFNANVIRTGWTAGNVAEGVRRQYNATQTRNAALNPRSSAVLTVASNNFATGTAIIKIGDYELVSGVDYLVGANPNATATNISVALAAIPEASIVLAAPDVQVLWEHPGRIRLEVVHLGTITNFTLSGLGADPINRTGLLNDLGVTVAPPILTA